MKLNISIYVTDSDNFLSVIFPDNTSCIYINKIVSFRWIIFSCATLALKGKVTALYFVPPSTLVEIQYIFTYNTCIILHIVIFLGLLMCEDFLHFILKFSVSPLTWGQYFDYLSWMIFLSFTDLQALRRWITSAEHVIFFLSLLKMVGRNIITITKLLAK